jgi:transposase
MAKRKFKLTDVERKELLRAYRVCKDAATRTRYQAVRLYGEGYPEKEIEQITGCNRTSLMEWCRAYRVDPSQGLVDKRVGGNRAKLSRLQIEELQHLLHQYTPKERLGRKASTADGQFWTVEDLVLVVRERYGIGYQSRTSYSSLLRVCGCSFVKSVKIFKSRSVAIFADFEDQVEKI